ncbi:MAG: hypothetical protein IJ568_03370 [Bacilli bacterium]|nr:hypothetical protein [Bacilli bacterium]
MANVIRMNFDELDDYIASQNKLANDIFETGLEYKKEFSTHVSVGALVNSISVGLEGIAATYEAIANTTNIMKRHTDEMRDYELALTSKARELIIPKDFLNEDATEINTYNRSILAKIDGRAVTDGKQTQMVNEIDESTIAKEDLLNITRSATSEQKYDATSSVTYNDNMKNIKSDKEQQEQKISEDSVIGKSVLGDINKGDNQQLQNIDESSVIGRSMLGNISTGTTSQVQNIDTSAFAAAQILEQDEKEKKKKEQEAREKEAMNYNFEVPNDDK